MKKSDLRTGMVVTYRNGLSRLVLRDTCYGDLLVDSNSGYVCLLEDFDDNLDYISAESPSGWDIVRVSEAKNMDQFHIKGSRKIVFDRGSPTLRKGDTLLNQRNGDIYAWFEGDIVYTGNRFRK